MSTRPQKTGWKSRGFTRAQQGHFRPLVKAAWTVAASANQLDAEDKDAHRTWYETELFHAVGKESTADCDPHRDFEIVMAHFEAIAGNSIYWNMRLHGGDKRRVLHELRQLATEYDLEESYLQECARRATRKDALPDLDAMTAEDLLKVLYSIRTHTRRLRAKDPF